MSQNKKQKKLPLPLRIIRVSIRLLNRLVPPLADRLAVTLFFMPFRFKAPPNERAIRKHASDFEVVAAGKKIRGLSWGTGEKNILLLHGWSGRGTQFWRFIPQLLEAGYRVITFDGPAHGLSDGRSTNIIEFEEALKLIDQKFGGIERVVCHSFGGVAAFFAMQHGLHFKQIILIGSPTIGDEIVREFIRRIDGSERNEKFFHHYIMKRFNRKFSEFGISEMIRSVPHHYRVMIIHDEQDSEVPLYQAEFLKKELDTLDPEKVQSQLVITRGLGHNRILKDESVIGRVIEFLDKNHKPKSEKVIA